MKMYIMCSIIDYIGTFHFLQTTTCTVAILCVVCDTDDYLGHNICASWTGVFQLTSKKTNGAE
jgi:hypothetical protein